MREKKVISATGEHSVVEKINAGPLSEKPASELDAMVTKCHAKADEDSSDHVARFVNLAASVFGCGSASCQLGLLERPQHAQRATQERSSSSPFLAQRLGQQRNNGTNTWARPKPRAKTETSGNVVVCAMIAVRLLEQHHSCAGT